MRSAAPLRFTTWLTPGLPLAMFETIAAHVASGLGRDHDVSVESKMSGPVAAADDRFAMGLTDIGFICPPAYLWLTERTPPSVALVPLAPIYDDARNAGQPTYVSDVIVRADAPARRFADLRGLRIGYNERASLSGFVSLLAKLSDEGLDVDFCGELRQVGSHRRALELIESGDIDAAAVDANVLRSWASERPDRGAAVRSIDVLGPYPVQPVVVRSELGELVPEVADLLARPELATALAPFGVRGFGPVHHDDYARLAPLVDRAMEAVPASSPPRAVG
ncbi:MAG: PhnD/SsuA/transferrin family substrate-binding protein [Actinomycetota bacterium]